jgi:hypothetical protein
MSLSSDFWKSIDNRWFRLLTVYTGGFTTYNTGVMGSVVYMITAFLGGARFFLNSSFAERPNFGGQILVKTARLIHAKIRYSISIRLVKTDLICANKIEKVKI